MITNDGYAKELNVPFLYYRCTACSNGISTSGNLYQTLKRIQNTVRVHSSLYTDNKAALNAYRPPITNPSLKLYGVNWNQMSDRPIPSVQNSTISTGFYTSMGSKHRSATSSKPGCQTPGGIGCDIKHNSYDRYLNRIKGRGPLKQGRVPNTFGLPIPFNCAYPIYGGKTTKTNIVSDCSCFPESNKNIYQVQIQPFPDAKKGFQIGQFVYAKQSGTDFFSKATVISVNEIENTYVVQFENETEETFNAYELKYYFPCNCDPIEKHVNFNTGIAVSGGSTLGLSCSLPIELLKN